MRTFFPVEALDRWLRHRMLDVHTAIPCEVLKYDASEQTVDVRPQIKRYIVAEDDSRTAEALPDMYGVPVAFQRGGGYHLTFPISPGDYVLVIFAEEPTQSWRTKARVVAPGFLDRHGLNGPFALPLGFPDKEKLPAAPPTDGVELASDDGSVAVKITSAGVQIGDATATDSASLDSLVQAELQALSDRIAVFERVFTAWTPAPNDGGAALKTAYGADPGTPGTAPGSTAAAKVKLK